MRVRSFGGAGESGSQLSVVKLTNSEMDPSKGRHVADTLNEKKKFFFLKETIISKKQSVKIFICRVKHLL